MKRGNGLISLVGVSVIVKVISALAKSNKEVKRLGEINKKNDAILKLYNQWMTHKQEGKSVADYLKRNGYRKVAVYGMHYLGENLCEELKDSGIEIKYAIDKKAENISSDILLCRPGELLDGWDKLDVVIVTAFFFYDEIKDELSRYMECPILSFKEILSEL